MSDQELRLKNALQRLELATDKMIKTRGYVSDAKSLKVLEETIREQLNNANTRSSTRSVR